MSDKFYVASRKGLFVLERAKAGRWQVARTAFLGDPVTMVLDDPRDRTLYAALNLGHFGAKLRRSEDGGASWHDVAAPSFPAVQQPLDVTTPAPSVQQVWALEAGGPDRPGLLWAGTIPGAVFRSPDRGESWTLDRGLWDRPERLKWFGGGYDDPGVHSICVDPRDSRHVAVGVSCGGVWVTHDRGETWATRTSGMYAEYMPEERREDPDIQDPHRLVQCAATPDVLWAQHHNGVFHTRDRGQHWHEVTAIRPAKFGFAVAVHPRDADVAWFVPGVKDECRIPVEARLVVARTRDGGASFDVLDGGLPREHAYDVVFRHGLDVDGGGDRLAMGSTTGNLWVSEDAGVQWHGLGTHFPPIYQVRFAP